MKTVIIGHRQPDLDSISAALVYAEFLKKQGFKNIIAGYCDVLNNEAKYILEKLNLLPPKLIKKSNLKKNDQIVLVDHNEESQRLPGMETDQIIQIIDHHKANFSFSQPIKIDIRPWGSTSTIIYDYFLKNNLHPSPKFISLMLSAILSDTIGLNSPTTTDIDRQTAKKLSVLAGLKIKKLTLEIFKAKSNISDLTPKQIVMKDYKIYNFGGKSTLINQIETVEEKNILKQKIQLIKAMRKLKIEQKLDYIYCLVSNVLKVKSQLIFTNEEEQKIAERAFGDKGSGRILDIGSKISRKKEIVPPLEKVIGK